MRAASGSTQMLYSAAGVTLPSQHGAPPMTTQRPIFFGDARIARQRQRDIGQAAQRHQRQARLGVGEAHDRVDRVLALRRRGAAADSRGRRGRRGRGTNARLRAGASAARPRR